MILSYHPNYHDSYHDNHYEIYHVNYHDSYHDNHYDIKHKHNNCGQVAPAGGAPEHKGAVQVSYDFVYLYFCVCVFVYLSFCVGWFVLCGDLEHKGVISALFSIGFQFQDPGETDICARPRDN